MKPSPKSLGFIYKNQTQSAISDQKQQPSERGYEGRTGKAINCQSQHRSTSQSTTTITIAPPFTHLHSQTLQHKHSIAYLCPHCVLSSSLTRHNSKLIRIFFNNWVRAQSFVIHCWLFLKSASHLHLFFKSMIFILPNMASPSKLVSSKQFEIQHNKATHFSRKTRHMMYTALHQTAKHSCPLISTGLCVFGSRHQIKWEN